MALAANLARETRNDRDLDPAVQSTAQIYAGSFCAGGSPTHGTSAKIGKCYPFNDEAGAIPLGHAKQKVLGTAVAPLPRADIYAHSRIVESIAVTGLTGDVTDVFKLVYATDDTVLTLTRTAVNSPVGVIVGWKSATSCDVRFFSFGEMAVLALAGGNRRTWHITTSQYRFAAASDLVKGIVAPCHGRILAVYAICSVDPADTDVAATLTVEIDGTNVTGGVVTLAFGNTVGLKIAGSAVTAENVFHMGSLIDVETSTVTAGTMGDGEFSLYIDYEMLLGL